MKTFLLILIILFAVGALVSVVRGVIIFLGTKHAEVRNGQPDSSGLMQNRMMWRRIQFQALAVVAAVLFLLVARGGAN